MREREKGRKKEGTEKKEAGRKKRHHRTMSSGRVYPELVMSLQTQAQTNQRNFRFGELLTMLVQHSLLALFWFYLFILCYSSC